MIVVMNYSSRTQLAPLNLEAKSETDAIVSIDPRIIGGEHQNVMISRWLPTMSFG